MKRRYVASVPDADAFGVLLRVIDEGRRAKVLAPRDRRVADDVTHRLMRGLAPRR